MTNATTGSDRVIPDQQPPAGQRTPLRARLIRPAVAHWPFGLVVVAAIAVRIVVILGYPPILWFSDSYNYLYDAVTNTPDQVRPNGYPFFLQLLRPLHSYSPIALLQAAMGVLMGVAIYALLRRRGLPWWGATLPALPVLFDAYELHLEHMITADPLFIFLVTLAVVLLCWNDRPSILAMAIAGLLIGYATLVRSVGEPLLVVALVAMLVRRAGWLRLLTVLVTGLAPIGAYMLWFHGTYGQYALTDSTGSFLYSRVSTFAQCSKMNVPPLVSYLCDPTKLKYRPVAGEYIWADNELIPYDSTTDLSKPALYTPMYLAVGSDTSLRFTQPVNAQAKQFAESAIESQPMAYARVVIDDVLHTFGWNRQPDPHDYYGNGPNFQFVSGDEMNLQIPWYVTPVQIPGNPTYQPLPGNPTFQGHSSSQTWCDAKCRLGDPQAVVIMQAERDFAGPGHGFGFTKEVQPWAHLLKTYQRYIYLPGTVLGLIVLIGAAGVLGRWRRWGGVGLLPWLVGALLIVLPAMTAGFSYRYVLAAVPVACLAAGLAFARDPGPGGKPRRSVPARGDDPPKPPRSVRALAADLRRNLGRGGTVDQE
ncbi:MAG TPA: hypothetical protein VKU77_23565 [Streptosporangiaceae bacterium]|nr:hypothetical protein [Streptosporangiaceae bacterium]